MSGVKTEILLEAGTNELEIIEFGAAGKAYGVNVAKVKKVLHYTPDMLTRIHGTPRGVEGVIYFQNKPILLINLREFLRLEGAPIPEHRQLAIVTQFNDVTAAFLVDAVNRIHRVSWKALSPLEEISLVGNSPCVTGTITIENRVLMVLDLEHLMSEVAPETSIKATVAAAKNVAVNPLRSSLRVIYAEDSAMIRRLTSEQLRKAGFTNLQVYENGQLALNAIRELIGKAETQGKPAETAFDLLLTDIEMPQLDGLTLCRTLREELQVRAVPVVIYSSLINEQMAAKCRSVGSNAHISKPKIEQIVEVLDRLGNVAAN